MNTKIDKSNIRFRFGKSKDQLICDVIKNDLEYVSWYCKMTQFESDKKIISELLNENNTKLKI